MSTVSGDMSCCLYVSFVLSVVSICSWVGARVAWLMSSTPLDMYSGGASFCSWCCFSKPGKNMSSNIVNGAANVTGMVIYSTVFSPLDRSKRFTLHPLADLFIPPAANVISLGSIQPRCSYCAMTIHSHFLIVYSQVLIYTAE